MEQYDQKREETSKLQVSLVEDVYFELVSSLFVSLPTRRRMPWMKNVNDGAAQEDADFFLLFPKGWL